MGNCSCCRERGEMSAVTVGGRVCSKQTQPFGCTVWQCTWILLKCVSLWFDNSGSSHQPQRHIHTRVLGEHRFRYNNGYWDIRMYIEAFFETVKIRNNTIVHERGSCWVGTNQVPPRNTLRQTKWSLFGVDVKMLVRHGDMESKLHDNIAHSCLHAHG